jgi:hypothetical protein
MGKSLRSKREQHRREIRRDLVAPYELQKVTELNKKLQEIIGTSTMNEEGLLDTSCKNLSVRHEE